MNRYEEQKTYQQLRKISQIDICFIINKLTNTIGIKLKAKIKKNEIFSKLFRKNYVGYKYKNYI